MPTPGQLKRSNGSAWDVLHPETTWASVLDKPTTFTPTSHSHGNITNAGAIGSTPGLMVKTGASGVLVALAPGSVGQYLQHDGTWSIPNPYSAMSTAEGQTGTETTSRVMRADYLKAIIQYHATPYFAGITAVSASRNLATTDVNDILFVTGTYTLTIPANTFTAGSQITIIRTGTGIVTVTAASGVTLNGVSAGSKTITTQYKPMTLICYSANVWYEIGV